MVSTRRGGAAPVAASDDNHNDDESHGNDVVEDQKSQPKTKKQGLKEKASKPKPNEAVPVEAVGDIDGAATVSKAKSKGKKNIASAPAKLVPVTNKVHKKFDGEDDFDDAHIGERLNEPIKLKGKRQTAVDSDDDSPDVVTASHDSIQYLRSLHENMVESITSRKTSKKKRPSERKRDRVALDENAELDSSVLGVLDSNINELLHDENKSLQKRKKRNEVIDERAADNSFSIDKYARKCTKM
jgi:hypothetical protein